MRRALFGGTVMVAMLGTIIATGLMTGASVGYTGYQTAYQNATAELNNMYSTIQTARRHAQ